MKKRVVLCLIFILAASSMFCFANSSASIPKPSVPEFTVKLVDNSYEEPTIHGVNPYTGENYTIPSFHVENKSIEVKITNQPFVAHSNGINYSLYYEVRVKGHFEENWVTPYQVPSEILVQPDYEYTIVSCFANYPAGSLVDFKVEAYVGHLHYEGIPGHIGVYSAFSIDATSGWSEPQTITIPASADSFEYPLLQKLLLAVIGVGVVLVLVGVGLLVYCKRRRHQTTPSSPVPNNN
jgi:hypothetical protein